MAIEKNYRQFICKECGSEMLLDDLDRDFLGKYDEYWVCCKCMTSCILQVRYGRPFKEIWHSENDGVKDYAVICKN